MNMKEYEKALSEMSENELKEEWKKVTEELKSKSIRKVRKYSGVISSGTKQFK